ncbi:hypothetical protein SteCoe_18051 [Stentor coeruleus]|uniref:Uncharacterized protein n=1 Tax=Stentor coeruleus TaxID=5963 RepID=A0A1R2BXF2_9CILI|nr:hypothetical protein SteCoe_18051 [Stentor coeruleus]
MPEIRFNGKNIALIAHDPQLAPQMIEDLISKGGKVYVYGSNTYIKSTYQTSSLSEYLSKLKTLKKIDSLIIISPIQDPLDFNSITWDNFSPFLTELFSIVSYIWKRMKNYKAGHLLTLLTTDSFHSTKNSSANSVLALTCIGLMNTLKREGAKNHIKINTLVYIPLDSKVFVPNHVIPIAQVLIHDSFKDSGNIYEASAGVMTRLRVQRAGGVIFQGKYTAESVKDKIEDIKKDSIYSDYPEAYSQSLLKAIYINVKGRPKL